MQHVMRQNTKTDHRLDHEMVSILTFGYLKVIMIEIIVLDHPGNSCRPTSDYVRVNINVASKLINSIDSVIENVQNNFSKKCYIKLENILECAR